LHLTFYKPLSTFFFLPLYLYPLFSPFLLFLSFTSLLSYSLPCVISFYFFCSLHSVSCSSTLLPSSFLCFLHALVISPIYFFFPSHLLFLLISSFVSFLLFLTSQYNFFYSTSPVSVSSCLYPYVCAFLLLLIVLLFSNLSLPPLFSHYFPLLPLPSFESSSLSLSLVFCLLPGFSFPSVSYFSVWHEQLRI
jgi:hypothetical protein